MELKKITILIIFLLSISYCYSQTAEDSIAEIVKKDPNIESIYKDLQNVRQKLNGKKEYSNSNFYYSDTECYTYDTKFDEVHRQNVLYRCIYFINQKTEEQMNIQFYKTNEIDTKIEIWYIQNDCDKLIIGTYEPLQNIYKFEKLINFD